MQRSSNSSSSSSHTNTIAPANRCNQQQQPWGSSGTCCSPQLLFCRQLQEAFAATDSPSACEPYTCGPGAYCIAAAACL
jgi:hypothetical protein